MRDLSPCLGLLSAARTTRATCAPLIGLIAVAGCGTLLGENFEGYQNPACRLDAGCGGTIDNDESRVGEAGDELVRTAAEPHHFAGTGGSHVFRPIDGGGGAAAEGPSTGNVAGAPAAVFDNGAGGTTVGSYAGAAAGADEAAGAGAGDHYQCAVSRPPCTEAAVETYGIGKFTAATEGVFRSTIGASSNGAALPNDDGSVDVLTANGASFEFSRWWNGTFSGRHGTLAGDLDGDGRSDLLTLDDSYIGVIRTGRCQSFVGPEQWWAQTFNGMYGNFLGDIDGDRRADLVGISEGFIGFLRSTGSGFGPYEQSSMPTFKATYGIFLADVDNDRKADVIGLAEGFVGVYRSTGKACPAGRTCNGGGFLPYERWGSSFTFNGVHGNAVADINGDGTADIVAFGSESIDVGLSNGFGTLSYDQWSTEQMMDGTALLADVNGDGKADAVVVTGTGVRVRLSNPTGRGTRGTHFGPEQNWFTGPF